MSRAVIGYSNSALLGSVAASSSVGGLGPDQLQNDQGGPDYALQIPSTSGTITITYTGVYHLFGLFRHNLTTGATVTWVVKNGASTVMTGTSLAPVAGFRQSVYMAPAAVNGTSMVVTISDAGNPDGFLNIPLIYAGPLFQPAVGLDYQSSPGRQAQQVKTTTRSGAVIIRTDWIKRTYDMVFNDLKDVEVAAIDEIDLSGYQGNNILFVPNPASLLINKEAVFGELQPASGVTYPKQAADARGYRATMVERL